MHEGRSVRLTARDSACTTPHGLHCLAHDFELAEVVFAEVTVLVLFEMNSDFFDVRRFDVRRVTRVSKFTSLYVGTL